MASPVAVIPNPVDPTNHLLFWLNGARQQLVLEQRPLENTQQYTPYQDNGVSQGVIVNPSSLAAVMHRNLVTVYGITQPNVSGASWYVSKLSPTYNPISSSPGAVTTQPALAACADPAGNDWVYYLQLPQGAANYQIVEFQIKNDAGNPNPPFTNAIPSKDTNLAAVYFQATKERFVIFDNTDKKRFLFWVNSTVQDQTRIEGTAGVNPATPLAVTSVEGNDSTGPFLNIFLYYMDVNQSLNRIVGTASGSAIHWFKNSVVNGAPALKSSTLMTAATTSTENYIYYIPDGQDSFSAFTETISKDWFKDAPKGKA